MTGTPRGGILTQASILTVTSNPTRTSPVKRGKWILENILGTPPPPPPPGVEELKDDKQAELTGSLRQRMEQHRANPAVPPAISAWTRSASASRTSTPSAPGATARASTPSIRPARCPTARSFKGPAELRSDPQERQEAFARCLTEKMLTYALGRGVEHYDRCAVDDIVDERWPRTTTVLRLVLEIVKSDPFQKRTRQKGGTK